MVIQSCSDAAGGTETSSDNVHSDAVSRLETELDCIEQVISIFCHYYSLPFLTVDSCPVWARGNLPSPNPFTSPPALSFSIFYFSFFLFLLASSVSLLFHSFPFYQNSPTPFSMPDVVGCMLVFVVFDLVLSCGVIVVSPCCRHYCNNLNELFISPFLGGC